MRSLTATPTAIGELISIFDVPLLHTERGDVKPFFVGTPDMVADFMTKQTLRQLHERHCRRSFGKQDTALPLLPILNLLA